MDRHHLNARTLGLAPPFMYPAARAQSLFLSDERLASIELGLLQVARLEAHLAQSLRSVGLPDLATATQVAHLELLLLRARQGPIPLPLLTPVRPISGRTVSLPSPVSSVAEEPRRQKDLAMTTNSSNGLDLLRDVSIAIADVPVSSMRCVSDTASDTSSVTTLTPSSPSNNGNKTYIDKILKWDVLCGRGGRSNHHPGNKRYRHVVADMKMKYRCTEVKSAKTDLSCAIVDHVWSYGGRFLKRDDKVGRYYVLSHLDARKKTSQALRETKELKWTM